MFTGSRKEIASVRYLGHVGVVPGSRKDIASVGYLGHVGVVPDAGG